MNAKSQIEIPVGFNLAYKSEDRNTGKVWWTKATNHDPYAEGETRELDDTNIMCGQVMHSWLGKHQAIALANKAGCELVEY